MVRRDGIVKVLDFGLAKLTERRVAGQLIRKRRRWPDSSTEPGMVMGTARYMSPEQARGQKVDHAHGHLQPRRDALRDAERAARLSAAIRRSK